MGIAEQPSPALQMACCCLLPSLPKIGLYLYLDVCAGSEIGQKSQIVPDGVKKSWFTHSFAPGISHRL